MALRSLDYLGVYLATDALESQRSIKPSSAIDPVTRDSNDFHDKRNDSIGWQTHRGIHRAELASVRRLSLAWIISPLVVDFRLQHLYKGRLSSPPGFNYLANSLIHSNTSQDEFPRPEELRIRSQGELETSAATRHRGARY